MLLQVTTHSHASPESNRTLTACIACVRGSPGMAAEERARAKQELLVRCSLMVKIRIWVRRSVPPAPTHTLNPATLYVGRAAKVKREEEDMSPPHQGAVSSMVF